MLKIFVILAFQFVLCLAQNPTDVAKSYCNTKNCQSGSSIACQYTDNPNMKCSGQLPNFSARAVVTLHNSRRNNIALGKVPGYKPAVDMTTMKWSSELAQMAKYNVMRCIFGHDSCRNTNNFKSSGQNLYTKWGSALDNANPNDIIKEGINSWFKEYKLADMSYIDKYRTSNKQIGHFTVMVKNVNRYVGCALAKYKNGQNTQFLFACNYANTNIIGNPIYISGPSTSKCPNGKNPTYPGLCRI